MTLSRLQLNIAKTEVALALRCLVRVQTMVTWPLIVLASNVLITSAETYNNEWTVPRRYSNLQDMLFFM